MQIQPRCSSVTRLGSWALEIKSPALWSVAVDLAPLLLSALCCLLSWCKSTEFSEKTLGILNRTFLGFAGLAMSFTICWIVNRGQFMACIAICHSRKRYIPATLKLQDCPPYFYPTPAPALPSWHSKSCWVGSAPTMPVWRKGDALVSLTHSLSGSLETASGAGVTSRAANWATGSLTQILCAKAELTGSSLGICHVHLPLAAPFPCAAGEPGVLKCGRDFLAKAATAKVLMLCPTQGRQASLEIGAGSAKYVYFPISRPLYIKTQPTKWATFLICKSFLQRWISIYLWAWLFPSLPTSALMHFGSAPTGVQFWNP